MLTLNTYANLRYNFHEAMFTSPGEAHSAIFFVLERLSPGWLRTSGLVILSAPQKRGLHVHCVTSTSGSSVLSCSSREQAKAGKDRGGKGTHMTLGRKASPWITVRLNGEVPPNTAIGPHDDLATPRLGPVARDPLLPAILLLKMAVTSQNSVRGRASNKLVGDI